MKELTYTEIKEEFLTTFVEAYAMYNRYKQLRQIRNNYHIDSEEYNEVTQRMHEVRNHYYALDLHLGYMSAEPNAGKVTKEPLAQILYHNTREPI